MMRDDVGSSCACHWRYDDRREGRKDCDKGEKKEEPP